MNIGWYKTMLKKSKNSSYNVSSKIYFTNTYPKLNIILFSIFVFSTLQ